MLELNFLREKVALKQDKKKYLKYFVTGTLCGVGFLLLLVVIFGLRSAQLGYYNKIKANNQTYIDQNRQKFKISDFEKDWSNYLKELNSIDKMLGSRTLWALRLRELDKLLPKKMCIDKIVIRDIAGNKDNTPIIIHNMVLEVIALASERQELNAINEFINGLDKSNFFGKGAKLESQQRNKLNERDVELFIISIPIGSKG